MYAVALVKMPSQNRFLGTFDIQNWTNWWMSEPLPDTVSEILQNQAVYAQYHVCLCKLKDGQYAIFQSPDYGQTWRLVYTTSDTIYALYTIDPGRVLAPTSVGWLESQNSGTDWAYVSFQAPGARHVISVGNDVLFAHDGEQVWRSTDMARNWMIVMNCRNFQYLKIHDTKEGWYSYTGILYPMAMDGVYSQIAVGIGNILFVSDDLGDHWNMPLWVDPYPNYGPDNRPAKDRKIIQIIHTGSTGTGVKDNTWMFRMWHVDTGIVRHWYVYNNTKSKDWETNGPFYNPFGNVARFDLPFYSETEGMLSAYEVIRVGSVLKDKVVFSAQKKKNTATGAYEPSLRYSVNGGLDWLDIDLQSVSVKDSQTGTEITGAFTEDSEASYSWVGQPCHNKGKWVENLKWLRAQSYDMSWILQGERTLDFGTKLETSIALHRDQVIDLSSRLKKLMQKPVGLNAPVMDTFGKDFQLKAPIQKTIDLGYGMNNITVLRRNQLYTITNLLQKQMNVKPLLQASIIGPAAHGYGMKTWLVNDGSDRIYIQIDTMTSQEWDIRPKNWPSSVHDSTQEDIDDAIGS